MHGPTEQPHSRVCGQWYWVLWWLSVSNLFTYLFMYSVPADCSLSMSSDLLCLGYVLEMEKMGVLNCTKSSHAHPFVLNLQKKVLLFRFKTLLRVQDTWHFFFDWDHFSMNNVITRQLHQQGLSMYKVLPMLTFCNFKEHPQYLNTITISLQHY